MKSNEKEPRYSTVNFPGYMYHEFTNRGWFDELDLEGIRLIEISSPGVDRMFQMPFGRYDEFIEYCKGNWQSICSTQNYCDPIEVPGDSDLDFIRDFGAWINENDRMLYSVGSDV